MNIRLFNTTIFVSSNECIACGEVWIKDDTIVYVGDGKDLDLWYINHQDIEMLWDEEIDCLGNLLIAGFKDAHTHSPMTALRSYADELPLQKWLTEKIFPFEALMTHDDMYWFSKIAVLEYLSSGITGIMDMYFDPYAVADACEEMGMRCCLSGAVNDFANSLDEMEQLHIQYNDSMTHPLISFQFGFHGEYTCSYDLLKNLSDLSNQYKKPVFAHISETRKEVEDCYGRYHMTPIEFLDSLGMFTYGGGAFHCVFPTEKEVQILKEKNISVITNPAANLKLASGIAPIHNMLKNDILVAIGTDGPAGNNALDMFREMYLVSTLAKYREKNATAISPIAVYDMSTLNGNRVMGNKNNGVLKEGYKADLVLIDLHKPNMQPINNILNNLIYSGNKTNVKFTMIGGKILYRDGIYKNNIEENIIYEECNRRLEIIKRKLKNM